MDNNPQWKFIETLNYGSYNVKVYSDEQQGLILYQYFTRDNGFCDYSYLAYTNEVAKQLLEQVGIQTYDSGEGTLGIKNIDGSSTIMFGAGKKEIDKLVEKYSIQQKINQTIKQDEIYKNSPMTITDYLTGLSILSSVFLIYWLIS